MHELAALCVNRKSIYKQFENVDCYDIDRDARTFAGGLPVIAHPPCRAWSAFTSHQAKPREGEKELGPFCVDQVLANGGILEHPAYSRLFDHCGLPPAGKGNNDVFTISIWQSWFGYDLRKATWLCFVGIDRAKIDIPFRLTMPGGDRRREQLMSKNQRMATTEQFARWLIDLAKTASVRYGIRQCAAE